jgi:hypothetical protein
MRFEGLGAASALSQATVNDYNDLNREVPVVVLTELPAPDVTGRQTNDAPELDQAAVKPVVPILPLSLLHKLLLSTHHQSLLKSPRRQFRPVILLL